MGEGGHAKNKYDKLSANWAGGGVLRQPVVEFALDRKPMTYRKLIAGMCFLGIGAAVAGFDEYPVSSLANVIAKYGAEDPAIQNPGDVMLDMALHPAKSRVVCDGKVRPVSSERRRFIEHLFGAQKRPQLAEIFKDEVLCTEGDTQYWLPIQAAVLPYFRDEVVAGKPVDLYVMHLGALRSATGQLERLFAINEFVVVKAVQPGVPADGSRPAGEPRR